MSTISDSIFIVKLPSGNNAVYSLQPQYLNLQHWGASLNQTIIEYGTQIAHENQGKWYKPGGWQEITDSRTIALLEHSPEA